MGKYTFNGKEPKDWNINDTREFELLYKKNVPEKIRSATRLKFIKRWASLTGDLTIRVEK